jgi:hypothetical protein
MHHPAELRRFLTQARRCGPPIRSPVLGVAQRDSRGVPTVVGEWMGGQPAGYFTSAP